MPNNYFEFKEFTIYQDKCAQKVGTDSVLLAAWVNTLNCKTALDIGSGTGLISLMLAQKSVNKIIAVEIDRLAYQQSKENIINSKFYKQIYLLNTSIQKYCVDTEQKFDLIVSNPPFFQHHLKSIDKQRNIARHNETLNYKDLIGSSVKLLNPNGIFCVVIPKDDEFEFVNICTDVGLFLNKILYVKPTPTKIAKRVLLEFSFNKKGLIKNELIIEDRGRHNYSKEYIELTKDFYLNL